MAKNMFRKGFIQKHGNRNIFVQVIKIGGEKVILKELVQPKEETKKPEVKKEEVKNVV